MTQPTGIRRNGTSTLRTHVPKILSILGLLLLFTVRSGYAQADVKATLYDLVNQQRINEGYAPLGRSKLLDQAAQRHADDLVTIGSATHEGSDGSGYRERIGDARYQAWNDGLMVNEALWIGLGTAEDAVTWFHSNPTWELFVDPRYREIGIGYAEDNGVRYFVVTFGSRPGVLPIFINDGATTTESPQVAVRLTNEEAEPLGEGNWIGKAIEVRMSNTPDFEDQPWQPWEPLLPWALPGTEPGNYPVYVEFRDGAGRTTVAEDTIRLVESGEFQPTPTRALQLPTPSPKATPSPETPDSSEEGPSPTPTLRPTAGATREPEPGQTFTPMPTWTPLPDDVGIERVEPPSVDWPVVLAFVFQGLALVLGAAAFLRRR